jgi:hypothetical protein
MLGLPSHYAVGKNIQISTFTKADLSPKEKNRFKESVVSIKLEYQITGESLPSLLNDQYDCQVILYFEVKLNSLKEAAFVCDIIQKLVKPLCVVRCVDLINMQIYCIAHKRLNLHDRSQIVIEDLFLTASIPTQFLDDSIVLISEYAFFDKLRNKANKLNTYLEMMVKIYIITFSSLWSGSKAILASKAWYNVEDVLNIFTYYKKVVQLHKDKKAAKTVSEQARVNSELKLVYNQLNHFISK